MNAKADPSGPADTMYDMEPTDSALPGPGSCRSRRQADVHGPCRGRAPAQQPSLARLWLHPEGAQEGSAVTVACICLLPFPMS